VEELLGSIARVGAMVSKVRGADDLEALLRTIVDTSVERTRAERGLLILEQGDGELLVRTARKAGPTDGVDVEGAVKYSVSTVRRVIETGAAARDTFDPDGDHQDLGASIVDLKLRALMCVPISMGEGEEAARGALYVDSKIASRQFNAQDLSYFQALSQQISIAVGSAKLHLDSLEKVRLEQSLEIASAIQSGLMPSVPEGLDGFDLFGWYQSAERASGDFYDFVPMKDGRFAVVVGDVTGHGIGPALVTASAQGTLRSTLRFLDDPGEAICLLNEDLSARLDDGMFVTLFLGIFSKDCFSYLNAGHTPPLIWRAATGEIETVDGDGPALGMMDSFPYETPSVVQLEAGDVFLALTDGIVEARAAVGSEELYGEEEVREVLSELAAAGKSAEEIGGELVQRVLKFVAGYREDDMTLVVVRRLS
jgi:sigma-B regulation protein RsbU (phosphoserine phosphatase)